MKKACISFSILLVLFIGFGSIVSAKGLPTALPEEVGLSSKRLTRIDKYIQSSIDQKIIAGAVTLVARRGKVAQFEAYGMADIEDRKPMSKDAMFRICSMSKVISAVAGMMVWEEGYFRLSDPVSMYIPEMKNTTVIEYDPKDRTKYEIVPAKSPMRIVHAFNFTAGFTYKSNYLAGPALTKMLDDAGITNGFWPIDYDLAEYFKRRSKIPFLNHPGEQWNYGMHLEVVARLVEIFSGMRFGDFCRERIFKPLGMKDTYFYVPDEKLDRVAPLYFKTKQGLEKAVEGKIYDKSYHYVDDLLNPFWYTYKGRDKYYGAGEGIITTTKDYAKFLQMMLNGGELNGVRILGRKTIEFMTRNHVSDISCCLGSTPGWGLGVAVITDPGKSHFIGTPGAFYWGGWMSTRWVVDPKEELLLVIMTQVLPEAVDFKNKFIDMVYQAIID